MAETRFGLSAASATANDQASPKNNKTRVCNSALALVGVEHGGLQAESQHTFDFTTETCAVLTLGGSATRIAKVFHQ
jgi:hypothetical protein